MLGPGQMQGKEILRLVDSLHRNKEIDQEVIFLAIEGALQSAARKHFGSTEDIVVEIDRETGEMAAVMGGERIEPEMWGRIAAQSAKQIILQRIREAEGDIIYQEYSGRVNTLVTGSVQRFEGGSIVVNLERTEAILPRSEQIPGEHYQAGERLRAVVLDVRKMNSLVKIFLSRTSKEFIRRLFELEVPEVAEGIVQIRRIAREPGLRTKVAVESLDARVDCIGACVGVRGTRIKSIIDEVKGEKIDIIPWSEAPESLIADSLRPAEIMQITLEEGERTRRAIVTVPEDQLSLAIGWKGQNVRLAVKMTGWDIDIEPPEPAVQPGETEGDATSPVEEEMPTGDDESPASPVVEQAEDDSTVSDEDEAPTEDAERSAAPADAQDESDAVADVADAPPGSSPDESPEDSAEPDGTSGGDDEQLTASAGQAAEDATESGPPAADLDETTG